ncbi:1-deoxy-D-xylulose-5-phosphate reductoisomerase [Alkalilimnicola ehrlichii MLHE-1]|uniref:1-deoxy-D-xylulose 5-phosphate reductoisomerase n=1 Tax=Alkalilimnicola ehrlichii (strain ATCC BAA-1101 / DSM 17681 / MLHE-1) TaxID=187272 RepID=Q0A7I6_ALKEH|nr:1-deoxy-D-xylulose-5-phosphate reductoisomerase [Alkalilimnicola ehrlichii]ABI57201.1 1-deoxy-D-xylulose 5-phosphate reductoisomerase [Alkalilimnicola ehrlichii MLHE-1]
MVAHDAVTGLSILGATGSIGTSTLDVVARHPDRFRVRALAAHRDVAGMAGLCRRFRPELAVMADPDAAVALRRQLGDDLPGVRVAGGEAGLIEAATWPGVDCVVAAIVGAAGLMPTLAAARDGRRILLANKEVLVMAGELFMAEARAHGAVVLPVDSEHNAIFQCLPEAYPARDLDSLGIRRLILTASGGPFRARAPETLAQVTPDEACAHPNWSMGRKISVDSATMMNKGLELIEACRLFSAEPGRVDVVIHPQSIVHSLVEYRDGSLLAQLGQPDMRIPIAHALGWPERLVSGAESLDLAALARLDFEAPDPRRFPCLQLAYDALEAGGHACAVLNAANEVAVEAFLHGEIGYTRIAVVVAEVLERMSGGPAAADLEAIRGVDNEARSVALQVVRREAG